MLLLRRPVLRLYSGRGEITDLGAKFANVTSFATLGSRVENKGKIQCKTYVRNKLVLRYDSHSPEGATRKSVIIVPLGPTSFDMWSLGRLDQLS